ncbi:hypothetical protein [Fibrella forsythiae]|nr:hypothetical protein [Fibrella forsythiae]
MNTLFPYLPYISIVFHLAAYVVGMTLGILGIKALRKYLRT